MEFTVGISPCPNDIFIFDAIINHKIDLGSYEFNFIIEDVEYLNKNALVCNLDITKLSYFAYGKVVDLYHMLKSGGALGTNCGPLLISKNQHINLANGGTISPDINLRVGIPGENTTANFLLSLCYPQLHTKSEMLFSDIEDALLAEKIDLGLIIHESRFTYKKKGLSLIKDLGVFWQDRTNTPLPLGGIVVRRALPSEVKIEIDKIISDSVSYAFDHPDESLDLIKTHAQEMDDEVIKSHIDLYVNHYSITLGEEGMSGVNQFFTELVHNGVLTSMPHDLVVGAV